MQHGKTYKDQLKREPKWIEDKLKLGQKPKGGQRNLIREAEEEEMEELLEAIEELRAYDE